MEPLTVDISRRVPAVVRDWAKRTPQAIALIDATGAVSYSALAQRMDAVAHWFETHDIQQGDRILIIAENCVALAVLILAAHERGITVVMENARRAASEMVALRNHCEARAEIFLIGNSPDAALHAAHFDAVISSHEALGPHAVVLNEVARDDADWPRDAAPAVMIYTTGTTGKPKGVMLAHRTLAFIAGNLRNMRAVSPDDVVYGILPITHIMGLSSVLCGTLVSGARVHLVPRFSAPECLRALREAGITMLQGAPAMFAKLAAYSRANRVERVESMRFTASGGAPIDPVIKAEVAVLFGTHLHNGYGLTEASASAWTRFEDENSDESVGRPLPGAEVRIAPRAPGDEVGELWVRGPHVMMGYFRNPGRTAEVLTEDGWFNTEDLAKFGEDGRIHVVGRTKDLIIRSGFNVYPLEVEIELAKHPAVLHCAVLGRCVVGNEEVVAVVELVEGAKTSQAELLAHLEPLLAPYKRPSEVVFLDALPIAANGKVLKNALTAVIAAVPTVASA